MSTDNKHQKSGYSGLHNIHDCEGCGESIRRGEGHYLVAFGLSGDELVPLGQQYFYHTECLDPYMITIWLSDGQSVSIALHKDFK